MDKNKKPSIFVPGENVLTEEAILVCKYLGIQPSELQHK
jgi:hypothetical protein